MSKYCPYRDEDVIYPTCQECDRPICNKNIFFCLIVGSRSFSDYTFFTKKIDFLLQNHPDKVIVSGGAKGADSLAERYAKEHNLPYIEFLPNWDRYGKQAGFLRNLQMHEFIAKQSKRGVVAFWDGHSKGTVHNFELSKQYSNPIKIIDVASNI